LFSQQKKEKDFVIFWGRFWVNLQIFEKFARFCLTKFRILSILYSISIISKEGEAMINIVVIYERLREEEDLKNVLASLPDVELCGNGQDGYHAVKLVSIHKPDIVILDSRLNTQMGADTLHLLKRISPSTAIVLLISRIDGIPVRWMIDGVPAACILRDTDMHRIETIIREVHSGGRYINPAVAMATFSLLANKDKTVSRQAAGNGEYRERKKDFPRRTSLSPTERQIFAYIAKGRSNSEIAECLRLKSGTVRNYVSSAMRKAGLKNRIQIALYVLNCGITGTPVWD
jgi:DNA-binding NarL/FixJ family response regulator